MSSCLVSLLCLYQNVHAVQGWGPYISVVCGNKKRLENWNKGNVMMPHRIIPTVWHPIAVLTHLFFCCIFPLLSESHWSHQPSQLHQQQGGTSQQRVLRQTPHIWAHHSETTKRGRQRDTCQSVPEYHVCHQVSPYNFFHIYRER